MWPQKIAQYICKPCRETKENLPLFSYPFNCQGFSRAPYTLSLPSMHSLYWVNLLHFSSIAPPKQCSPIDADSQINHILLIAFFGKLTLEQESIKMSSYFRVVCKVSRLEEDRVQVYRIFLRDSKQWCLLGFPVYRCHFDRMAREDPHFQLEVPVERDSRGPAIPYNAQLRHRLHKYNIHL